MQKETLNSSEIHLRPTVRTKCADAKNSSKEQAQDLAVEQKFSARTNIVFGNKLSKIEGANILVVGVGGVGGHVVECLTRLGVRNLTIVDCDNFEPTNLNRQIFATTKTLGKSKVEVAKERICEILPTANVRAINKKLDPSNVGDVLDKHFDFVIDAIDDVNAKVALVAACKKRNIDFVCSMGTGNRCGMPKFEVADIFSTTYDKLAKKMRSLLKKQGITENVPVVFTKEPPQKCNGLGSVVYYPMMCAGTIVSYVANAIANT